MLSHTLLSNVPGAVVELGCNAGATSVFLRMILDEFAPHRALHIYDSFQGLPLKGAYDRCFDAGDLRASTAEIEANFRRCGLRVPYVHEGWFQDTLPTALPHPIAFAYLDSDFYASIMVSLEHVYPRLAPHAVVLIDDYGAGDHTAPAAHGLPGVK